MSALLITTLAFTTITDIKWFKVYNVVMYPAIICALYFNPQNIYAVIVIFGIMALLFETKKLHWSGGDIKIFMLIASVQGISVIVTLAVTVALVSYFREVFDNKGGLPITPFAFTAVILTMCTAVAFHRIVL